MKAFLKHHRQQPQKTRLVADLIRGKQVSRAITELTHLNKRAATAMKKLLESAAANAKHTKGLERDQLLVKEIRVSKGITFRRFLPKARGRATPIRKRTSHIYIELSEAETAK